MLELLWPSTDGQYDAIQAFGAERGGCGTAYQSILLNKNEEKAFNSCCIVTRMPYVTQLIYINFIILFVTCKRCRFQDDMARGLDRIGLTKIGTRGVQKVFLKSRCIKSTALDDEKKKISPVPKLT